MGRAPEEKNDLTNVRIEKIGLCKHPAVPEATHLILKSRDGETGEFRQCVDPAARLADDTTVEKAESFLMGLLSLIRKSAGSEKKTATTEISDMDISKATPDQIQKANPELFAAIQKAALSPEAVKDKNGCRVGAECTDEAVAEKNGSRVAGTKVADVTDEAVDTKVSTTKAPLAPQPSGGFDPNIAELTKGLGECTVALKSLLAKFDTSRPGEAAINTAEKKAVKATQVAVDTENASNGGTVAGATEATSAQATEIGKIDTSRPGEAAINAKQKSAVKATAAALDDEREANDSGIGAIADGNGDDGADEARNSELATLKQQVAALTKAMPRLENIEKAVAKVIRDGEVTITKSVEVENISKAGSKQAGQLDESGAKGASVLRKTVFGGAISTIALAKAGRETA
jgi:hypothetical protein